MPFKNKNFPFIIFAAGKSRRFQSRIKKIPKVLFIINGKPLIQYVLDTAGLMGAKNIFIVVDYKKEIIMRILGKKYKGIKIKYIINENSKGLVDNLSKLAFFVNSDFVLLLGDEIYINSKHGEMISFYKKNHCDGICGVREDTPRMIKKNYSVKIINKKISEVMEKPDMVKNVLQGCGTYIFKSDVFNFIKKVPINKKTGKKELVDLIQIMINNGKKILPFNLGGLYVNVNKKEDLTAAKKIIKK